MDLTDLFIGMSTKQKQKQEIQITTNLQDFLLMLLFKELEDYLSLLKNNTDGDAKQVKRNSHGKYFLPRVNITNYDVLIDGRNF